MKIFERAKELIYGEREKAYGHPSINLKHIANLWSAYLGVTILPKDVCQMMVLLKVARTKATSVPVRDQFDTVVDQAAYTALLERLEE